MANDPTANNSTANDPTASAPDKLWQLALANCTHEPVHIPGYIQPFGAIIATDENLETITHVSANLASVLAPLHPKWQATDALNQPLETILSEEVMHELSNACAQTTIDYQRERLGHFEVRGKWIDLAVHFNGTRTVLEIEPATTTRERPYSSVMQVKSMLHHLPKSSKMLSVALEKLRYVTGFDRAVAYKLLPDGVGEVVAENCTKELEPLLGLRFPASDIPETVREILLKQPLRIVADINEPLSPILSKDKDEEPLDLSLTFVRGFSAVHPEYLGNMGVQTSLVIAIIINSQLWGLFSCHHPKKIKVSADTLSTLELFAQLFSLQFEQALAKERVRDRKRAASTLAQVVNHQVPDSNWQTSIIQVLPQLSKMLQAQGAAIVSGPDLLETDGEVPSESSILDLVEHSRHETQTQIVTIESFQKIFMPTVANWGNSAGAILLALCLERKIYLIFFRNETIKQIRWGGNPEEGHIVEGDSGPLLHPRNSFAEYKKNVEGRCEPWSRHDFATAIEIRTELIRLVEDRVQLFQQRQQDLVIAELNHRVKNILALIRSIARRTNDSAVSLENYTRMLEQRIASLALAHDLVAGNQLEWPTFRSLLDIELRPYLRNGGKHIKLVGPPVGLKATFVPTLVLVLHELTSNAVKHGALSVANGQLTVHWQQEDGGLRFRWQEASGPKVNKPKHRGFGRDLIERAIPYEFEGEAELSFIPAGVKAEFWLPSDLVKWTTSPAVKPDAQSTKSSPEQSAEAPLGSILIVEDNMLLAMEMEDMVKTLGFENIDSAPNVSRALKLLTKNKYRVCLLDIDLKKETSFEIAHYLVEQQIPFAFTSGYNSKYTVPEPLKSITLLKKPVELAQLQDTLKDIIPPSSST